MRKLLLTLVAFVTLSTAANAQSTVKFNAIKAESGVIQKRQGAVAAEPKTIKKTRSKVALGENQRIMGNYTSDSYTSNGLGLPKYPGNLRVATIISCTAGCKFDGSTVKSIRFALAQQTQVTRVFMITVLPNGNFGSEVVSQSVENSVVGWNTVELTTPYTINATNISGYLVGFEYVQSNANDGQYYNDECYPLSFVDEGSVVEYSFIYGDLGQGIGWYNMGADNGNLSVQCIVEKESGFPQYDLIANTFDVQPFAKAGDQFTFYGWIVNDGTKVPTNYTLGLSIDENEVAEINSADLELTPNGDAEFEASITLPAELAKGAHSSALYVKTINGAVPTEYNDNDKLTSSFKVYTQSLPRQKQLLEHMTSQYCTFCPLGVGVLNGLMKKRDDIAWVSLHQNMSSGNDIYTITAGTYIASRLQANGLPGAVINRTRPLGADGLGLGLGYSSSLQQAAINYLNNVTDFSNCIPALASVNIATAYNEETRMLDITVTGDVVDEFADFMPDGALTVYLTEDGLVAKQYNNGTWVQNFKHENVLRSVASNMYGDVLTITNGKYEKTYSVKINSAWKIENMHVVAAVGRKLLTSNIADNAWTTNAERVPALGTQSSIDNAIANGAEATVVARYNANGVRLAAPVKGINIVKMSDGTTRKVVVE